MYINTDSIIKWKQKLQRQFRKTDCSLRHKQYENKIQVYDNIDCSPVDIYFEFNGRLPNIIFRIPQTNGVADITPEALLITKHVLTSFIDMLKKHKKTDFTMEITTNDWNRKQQDKETSEMLAKEFGLISEDERATNFFSTEAYSLFNALRVTSIEVCDKCTEFKWGGNQTFSSCYLDKRHPTSAYFRFQGISEMGVEIKIDYENKNYVINYASKYHKKEVIKTELTLMNFREECELFVAEEKFKALFAE